MYMAILGRQPQLSMAELEILYGGAALRRYSEQTALVEAPSFDPEILGGCPKAGRVVAILSGNWKHVSQQIVQAYADAWQDIDHKITLGISVYDLSISPRDVQYTGIMLKKRLREHNVSLRLIPNAEAALNTATSHHNKLGLSDNRVELLIARGKDGSFTVAESMGAQNITALARRDQGRPKRDAFVGMLPPKLACMMVNMSGATTLDKPVRLLDPFCGTGVLLQEAALLGLDVYGTDLSEKMINYSRANLDWLADSHKLTVNSTLEHGDAMDIKWQPPISAVASEAYLGQPFSAPPSPAKLREVVGNCNHIISSFLTNLATQIPSGTPICLAVPAWRSQNGSFTHLPFVSNLSKLGYTSRTLTHSSPQDLLYFREDQVVARELLLLTKN